MNERIKELAEQANLITHKVPNGLAHLHTEQDVEKFAELIVRECIQVCNSRAGNSDYNTGRMHCASDIKEHFGIE